MSNLVDFKENMKDNRSTKDLTLDHFNYLSETKRTPECLKNGSDALAKCVILCGELFANKIRKGEVTLEEIESFEANLLSEKNFVYKNNNLNLANNMVKEGNLMALNEYENRFGEANKRIGLKKVA